MNPPPLGGLSFSLAGPGRVGRSLAAWAAAAGAEPVAVAGRDAARTRLAARELGATPASIENLATAGQNFLLVAVSDGSLDAVAAGLAGRPQAAVVWHTAGSRDASALAPLRAGGSAVGSLHPLCAFPAPLPEPAAETFFALDGDPPAIDLARRLVAAWSGRCAEVPAEARKLYHLAASLAAGGAVTLLAAAGGIARRLGLPGAVAEGYRRLAAGAIAAVPPGEDPAGRITGPVARGDTALVVGQLSALEAVAPETVPLVVELALETLRQRERLGGLDEGQMALRAALRKRFIP